MKANPTAAARWVASALAVALFPLPARAHLISTGLGPVYDGIAHFALTLEDLLPAFALALLAGLRGKDHARHVVIALPLAWFLGGGLGMFFTAHPPIVPGWLPLLALGILVASDLALPRTATTTIAIVFGTLLGFENGISMAQTGTGGRGVLGASVAVFVLTTLVAACVAAWRTGWLRIAWRVAGSWIAAGGLLLLGWSLR